MALREQLFRHRKDNRFILAVLGGALLFFSAVYYLLLLGRALPPDQVTSQLLLFVLRSINVLLILTMGFVLFRNLVKLWVEQRRRTLGSSFQTKLVATYIAISLVPVLLLFAYASELIQGSIENLFRTPVEQVLDYGSEVARELRERTLNSNQRSAERVIQRIAPIDLSNPASRTELGEILKRALRDEQLDILLVYDGTEFVHAVIDPQAGAVELPDPGSQFLLTAVREGTARRVIESVGQNQSLLLAATSLPPRKTGSPTLLLAGSLLDPNLSQRSTRLIEARQQYLQLKVQEPDLKATYLLMFLMITLVILLTSSWVGLFLARRVTIPIRALADGTRRIMAGDLEHLVEAPAGDELGVLVDSFNRMTTELRDSRAMQEHHNEELRGINRSLDEERGLIRAVLRNVGAGVLSVDEDGRVSTCNDAAMEMLGQSEKDILGRPLERAWADSERKKLLALFEYDPLGREHRQVELRLGGQWKTFEVNLTTMFDSGGDVRGHVMVLEDRTQLIQAQQLATWNQAARRIAHEIKNPLTPIRLSAERLLRKYEAGSDDLGQALEDGVETIQREVTTMQKMVDEFSRFARMPRPQPTEVELQGLFKDTLKLYRDVKPGLEMGYFIDPGIQSARFDREQMRGVLINLLDNAVDATPTPGSIHLRAVSEPGALVLTVEDSGPGIPAESKEKLFQPYFSTKGRGTGLGLAIVYRIISDHNGTIRVLDRDPEGTIFRIELPQ